MQELFEKASILFEEEEEILKFSHAEESRSLALKVRLDHSASLSYHADESV